MQGLQVVLIVFQVFIAVALIISVLLQRSEGGALGMGGGGSGIGGLFSPRGAADTLTRTTAILAALFFAVSMGLTLLALHGRVTTSVVDTAPTQQSHAPAAPPKPTGPVVPPQ